MNWREQAIRDIEAFERGDVAPFEVPEGMVLVRRELVEGIAADLTTEENWRKPGADERLAQFKAALL